MTTSDLSLPLSRAKSASQRGNSLTQDVQGNRQLQRVTKHPKHRTRFIQQRHSFSPLMLFFILIVLFVTGSFAQDNDDNSSITSSTSTSTAKTTLPSETRSSTSATATDTGGGDGDEDEGDEDGIPVVGTDDMPKPFDTSIGKTFITTTCPAFFTLFLNDPDYQDCLPLSAMLQNSNSFFKITKKSGFATTRVLDVACGVDYNKCAAKMEYYGQEIRTPERCGQDFEKKDQLVIEAYASFISYPSLFKAGCLKSDSGSYCYVDAVTNVTNPDDTHIYYLPLGPKLPIRSKPTCSNCTRDTMRIYQKYAGNSSLPLFDTYVPAASQINTVCGPEFVNTTVELLASVASQFGPSSTASIFTVTLLIAITF